MMQHPILQLRYCVQLVELHEFLQARAQPINMMPTEIIAKALKNSFQQELDLKGFQ
jgi:hypothetical protein